MCDSVVRKEDGSTGEEEDTELQKERAKEHYDTKMRQKMMEMFPDLHNATIYLPPQRFNRMHTTLHKELGLHVQHVSSVSDLGCDRAEDDVKRCLEIIRDVFGEPMCVIFNYSFDNYLDRNTSLPSKKPNKGVTLCPDVHNQNSHTLDKSVDLTSDTKHSSFQDSTTQFQDETQSDNAGTELEAADLSERQNIAAARNSGEGYENSTSSKGIETREKVFQFKSSFEDTSSKHKDSKLSLQGSDLIQNFPTPKRLFPTPDDLGDMRRGDFDVLIISQGHGCIVIEVKAVGYNQLADLDTIRKKIEQAKHQLFKSETVLRHMFWPELCVVKVLATPNISRQQLKDACEDHEDMAQLVCDCLSTNTIEEALARILCAEDIVEERFTMKSPEATETRKGSQELLMQWWKNVTQGNDSVHPGAVDHAGDGQGGGQGDGHGDDQGHGQRYKSVQLKEKLDRDAFERIVSRLAGPYSKVTVESTKGAAEARTVAECVHLTGLRYGRALLRSDQLELLDCQEHFLHLTGPPGSGKTLLLGLKGIEWAKQGDHVAVFIPQGVGWGSLISLLLYERVKQFSRDKPKSKKRRSRKGKATCQSKKCQQDAVSSHSQGSPVTAINVTLPVRKEVSSPNRPQKQVNPSADDSVEKPDLLCQDEDCPPNIHKVTVNKNEDTEKFVHDLLNKYSDRPLRILVDEGPTKVDEKSMQILLENIREKLAEDAASLQDVHRFCLVCKESGVSTHPVHIQSRSSSQQTDEKGARHRIDAAIDKMKKVQECLQTMRMRLKLLQPSNGKSRMTQSLRWKTLITDIYSAHGNLDSLVQAINQRLLSSKIFSIHSHELSADSEQLCQTFSTRAEQSSSDSRDCEKFQTLERSFNNEETLQDCVPHEIRNFGIPALTGNNRLTTRHVAVSGQTKEREEEEKHTASSDSAELAIEYCPLLDIEKTVTILNDLETSMMNASGALFNVENLVDFVTTSEVLSLLARQTQRQDVSVWSSGVTTFFTPDHFVCKTLTHCLRCPPTIQRVLQRVEKDMKECPYYLYNTGSLQDDKFPLPTDGPEVKLLNHESHMTEVKDIADCRQCGDLLAEYLLKTLQVGGESGLRWEDVVISGSFERNARSLPFVRALLHHGIQLECNSDNSGLTSPPPHPGKVLLIGGCAFQGLEAMVVVFVPNVGRISLESPDSDQLQSDLPDWLKTMGRWNRCHLWFIASRCLSQLVVFRV